MIGKSIFCQREGVQSFVITYGENAQSKTQRQTKLYKT